MTVKFLQGIRVLDLSQYLPGPFATQILADMGADVLKIEPPGGDPMRELNPVTNQRGPAPYHALVNAGKRIVRIDLKSDDGKQAFAELIGKADVMLESYRPGVLARLGFDRDRLTELNAGLIHCALSGYGQTGPQAQWPGHDINYLAMTGSLNVTGPKEKPLTPFPPLVDLGAAQQAAIAMLGALAGRGAAGKGTFLDVSMTDAIVAWQGYGMVQEAAGVAGTGPAPTRGEDLLNGGAACYQVYATSDDRFISLGAIETVFWENFCNAVERPEWISRLTEPLPQDHLIADVAGLIARQTRDHWDEVLAEANCCYHPVLTYAEVPDWPQTQARQLMSGFGADGAFDGIRFPVWVDGEAAPPRPVVREVTTDEALSAWSGTAERD